MANWPTYAPNTRGSVPPATRRNRAITDLYEPGSVFKTVTAVAALEEGIPTSAFWPVTRSTRGNITMPASVLARPSLVRPLMKRRGSY